MPNHVSIRFASVVVDCQQAHFEVTPDICEIIRKRARARLRWFRFQRFKDFPVVVSLKPITDSLPYFFPVLVCNPIERFLRLGLSIRQEKCPAIKAHHRPKTLLRE